MKRAIIATLVAVLLGAAGCTLPPPPPNDTTGALSSLDVAPGTLTPTFVAGQHDYGVVCSAGTNDLAISATPTSSGATVTVEGSDANGHVQVNEDGLVTISVTDALVVERYYVRCLPHDFPPLQVERSTPGPTEGWYLLTPDLNDPGQRFYVVILDSHGAVLWYKKTPYADLDLKRLPNGHLLWSPVLDGGVGMPLEYDLDGHLLHVWTPPATTIPDFHDAFPLPNGNMLVGGTGFRDNVDVSPLAPAFTGLWTVADGWLQELRPDGTVAWEWHSGDHIGIGETTAHLDGVPLAGNGVIDAVHINSWEVDADGNVILSARHSDAVYKIRRNPGQPDDGKILWKLGGNAPTEPGATHLAIIGDPYGGPARQHDARLIGNGHITLFDNRTRKTGQPARGVEYALDEAAGTATQVWQQTSASGGNSCCLGSTRRAADGSTLIGWGGMTPLFTEYDASGAPVLTGSQTDGYWNYRVVKEPLANFDRDTLRAKAGGIAADAAPLSGLATVSPSSRTATLVEAG